MGTPAGNATSLHLCRAPCTSGPSPIGGIGGRLVFEADDGVTGSEPWGTDGTTLGTRRLGDLCPDDCSAHLTNGVAALGTLFFRNDAFRPGLWRTDGTPSGTVQLADIEVGGSYGVLDGVPAGGALVFAVELSASHQIWASDGTPSGTRPIAEIDPDAAAGSSPSMVTVFGGKFYLTATPLDSPRQIYVSDGTPAGTEVLLDTEPSELVESHLGPQRVGARLVFFLHSTFSELEVWASDGTAAGTHPVAELTRFLNGDRPTLVFDDKLFFFTYPSGFWRTDGTRGRDWSSWRASAGEKMVPWRGALLTCWSMPASQGSSGGPTAPRPAPSRSSTPCRWPAASARSRAPRPSAIRSTSSPRRRPVRNSSGELDRHFRRNHSGHNRPASGPGSGSGRPHSLRRPAVLRRRRRGARPGAVEQRRHRGRHRTSWSRSPPVRAAPTSGISSSSAADSGSSPTTGSTGPSRGRPTAPRPAPACSPTSGRARPDPVRCR